MPFYYKLVLKMVLRQGGGGGGGEGGGGGGPMINYPLYDNKQFL